MKPLCISRNSVELKPEKIEKLDWRVSQQAYVAIAHIALITERSGKPGLRQPR